MPSSNSNFTKKYVSLVLLSSQQPFSVLHHILSIVLLPQSKRHRSFSCVLDPDLPVCLFISKQNNNFRDDEGGNKASQPFGFPKKCY